MLAEGNRRPPQEPSKLVVDAIIERPDEWSQMAMGKHLKQWKTDTTLPTGFVECPNTVYNIKHDDEGFIHRRQFRWLPYIPGKVACIPLAGDNILTLTGNMSGCWIVIFTWNGRTFVGHIGTVDNNSDAETLAAKDAWNMARWYGGVVPLLAYNPLDKTQIQTDPAGLVKLNTKGELPMEFLGAIWNPNQFYTVVITQPKGSPLRTRRVAAVVSMESRGEPIGVGFEKPLPPKKPLPPIPSDGDD
jgi:hypothetical protein